MNIGTTHSYLSSFFLYNSGTHFLPNTKASTYSDYIIKSQRTAHSNADTFFKRNYLIMRIIYRQTLLRTGKHIFTKAARK